METLEPGPGADIGNTIMMSGKNPFGAAATCKPQQTGPNLQRVPATQYQQTSQSQLSQGQQPQQMMAVMMPNQMAQQAGAQPAQGQPGQLPQMQAQMQAAQMQGMQMPQGAAMSGAAGSSSSAQNGAMQQAAMQGQGPDRNLQQQPSANPPANATLANLGSGGTLSSDNLPANATLAGAGFPPGTINLGPGLGPGGQSGYYVAIPIGQGAQQGGGGVAAAPGNWAPGGPGGFVQMQDGFSAAGGSRPGFGGDDGDFGRGRQGFGGGRGGGFDAGKGAFGAGKGAGKGFGAQKFAQPQSSRTGGNADFDSNWRSSTTADAEAAKDMIAQGAAFGAA